MTVERSLAVCMITSLFHPIIGGAERQAQQLAARLIRNGVEVCILTRRYPGLKAYEEIEGVPIHRVFTLDKSRVLASLSYTFSSLLWLFRNQSKYQIIHCHRAESPTTVGVLAKFLYGKRVIVKISGGDLGLVNQSIRKSLLSSVDMFAVLTGRARAHLIDCGFAEARIEIIPNGVDTNRYVPLSHKAKLSMREKLGLPIDEKLVIFVGRLHPVKGLDTLLYAWQKVSQSIEIDRARLLIVGEGPEEPFLRQLVTQLGLEATTLFLGRRDNVVKYLQSTDVLVLPSLSEGLPNALLEAMACGLAAVATDVGGSNDVINNLENGILIHPRDPKALSDALLTLLNDKKLAARLGQEARKTIEERYSLDQVVNQYMRLYQSLVSDR